MDKNISPDSKSNQLAVLLNENMEKSGAKTNKARVRLISMIISALCKVQTVSFHKLAPAFDNTSTADSWLRRLRRFIAGFDLCGDLIARLIFGLLPEKTGLKLVVDRTNWKFGGQNINIFMPGIACRNVAFPLMFKMLHKNGNSNSEERIALVDREFVGEKWTGYLNRERIRYYIRIRNNFKVLLPHKGETIPVSRLSNRLGVGESMHYPKIVEINGRCCYLSATLSRKRDEGPKLLVIISFNRNEQSFLNYRERWQVETLFKSLKSSGFDMENTHLRDIRRIEKLLCLVMIAFAWCYKAGDYPDRHVAHSHKKARTPGKTGFQIRAGIYLK